MFYKQLHDQFLNLARENRLLDKEVSITAHILKPTEALGNPDRKDFPLLKGKEALMQAVFMGSMGQAYTDAPSEFSGTLREIIDLPLDDSRQKALFIATLNAVLRHLHPDITTLHCKNNEPEDCAGEIAEMIQTLKPTSVGIIGLQPAILEACVKIMGPEKVCCIDRDEENRGAIKYGVRIGWGNFEGMRAVFQKSDVVLATGSSVTNGSLADILDIAQHSNTPVFFYGTTIAGTARLMGLNRVCFKST